MYVYVAIALIAAALSGIGTWRVQDWRYAAKDLERVQAAQRERLRQIEHIDTAAVGHEADKRQIRTEFITITERVEHDIQAPFYAAPELCLDDAGLRDVTLAVGAAGAASQPARAVSGPVGAGGR